MESGVHFVLRLPPYHPELNPIEKIWALVKNWVEAHNTTYKLKEVQRLAEQKFAAVTPEEWQSVCEHTKKIEVEIIEREHLMDEALDSMQFIVNTGLSDEESTDESDEDSSDELLSGIEDSGLPE